ncbi:MAG: papain-like cysteine protease family protein [Nitrospirales bacterium]
MLKVLLLKKVCLIKIAILVGIFLITGSCTKVDVRVTRPCCSPSEYVYEGPSCDLPEKMLSIEGFRQEATAWCWVASAQMVAKHLNGTSLQQCEIVDDLFNPISSCCKDPYTTECNRGWWPERALEKEGIKSGFPIENPPKDKLWKMITWDICTGKPLILAEYFLGGGGHSSVLYGFDGNSPGEESWVWAYDPLDDPVPGSGGPRGGMQWYFDEAIYFSSVPEDLYGREAIYVTADFE